MPSSKARWSTDGSLQFITPMDTEVTFKPVLPKVLCSTFAPCSGFPREAVSNKGVAATPTTAADRFLMNFRRSILHDNIVPPRPFQLINYILHHSIINVPTALFFLLSYFVLFEGMREALFAEIEIGYCHMDKLANLSAIERLHGFTVCCFPIYIKKASASWVRPVAIIDEE
jgi:hypothetical protein